MADDANKPAIAKVFDRTHAPIIFFDEAPVFTNYNGLIGVSLTANLSLPDGKGGVSNDQVATAFLRGNIQALLSLKGAIESALLLGAKTEGGTN